MYFGSSFQHYFKNFYCLNENESPLCKTQSIFTKQPVGDPTLTLEVH